jgi:hypothetical protein
LQHQRLADAGMAYQGSQSPSLEHGVTDCCHRLTMLSGLKKEAAVGYHPEWLLA